MGLFDVIGSGVGYLAGGAGKAAGLIGAGAGKVLGGKAEDAISNKFVPVATGFDASKALSKENRLPGQNYFDDRITKELLPAQQARDSEFFADIFNHGINPDQPELAAPTLPGQSNDAMVAAIQNKAKGETSQALRGITSTNQEASKMAEAKQQDTIAREAASVYQNEVNNFNQQYAYQMQRYQMLQQYKQAQSQAEATLWGSIFGGIGSVAGAAVGAKK